MNYEKLMSETKSKYMKYETRSNILKYDQDYKVYLQLLNDLIVNKNQFKILDQKLYKKLKRELGETYNPKDIQDLIYNKEKIKTLWEFKFNLLNTSSPFEFGVYCPWVSEFDPNEYKVLAGYQDEEDEYEKNYNGAMRVESILGFTTLPKRNLILPKVNVKKIGDQYEIEWILNTKMYGYDGYIIFNFVNIKNTEMSRLIIQCDWKKGKDWYHVNYGNNVEIVDEYLKGSRIHINWDLFKPYYNQIKYSWFIENPWSIEKEIPNTREIKSIQFDGLKVLTVMGFVTMPCTYDIKIINILCGIELTFHMNGNTRLINYVKNGKVRGEFELEMISCNYKSIYKLITPEGFIFNPIEWV